MVEADNVPPIALEELALFEEDSSDVESDIEKL